MMCRTLLSISADKETGLLQCFNLVWFKRNKQSIYTSRSRHKTLISHPARSMGTNLFKIFLVSSSLTYSHNTNLEDFNKLVGFVIRANIVILYLNMFQRSAGRGFFCPVPSRVANKLSRLVLHLAQKISQRSVPSL